MKKLNWIKIASLYIGAIMGAGFASGRECWQYFGVFGKVGFKGVFLITFGFIALGLMMTYIAEAKQSSDIGSIVSPFNSPGIDNVLGFILAFNLYWVIATMSAAGGSLLEQQFGINKIIGGLIIILLTIYTVLGNFKRISTVFSYISPILFLVCAVTILIVISYGFEQSGNTDGYEAGGMSPNWWLSALIYLSYNSMAMISMAGNSAITAKSRKDLYFGTLFGTLLLGLLTYIILKALLTDMAYSNSLDLPMLGFASRISPMLNVIYAVILYLAIYSAASCGYYAFTTKLPYSKYNKLLIVIGALVGFFIGLAGFKTLVEVIYSIMGYLGFVYIILIIINFFVQLKNNDFRLFNLNNTYNNQR